MKFKTTTSGNVKVNYIPSYTSPRGGRRACLCKDELTYKIECCTGELHAQGIGVINRTS
mgnify:CR=1 FL=1